MLMSTNTQKLEFDLCIPVRVAIVVGKVDRIPTDDCRSTWVEQVHDPTGRCSSADILRRFGISTDRLGDRLDRLKQ